MNFRSLTSSPYSIRWFRACFGFTLAICSLQFEREVTAQNAEPDWTVVLRTLQAQRDAVSSIKAEYLLESILSPELAQESREANHKTFEVDKARGNISKDAVEPRYVQDFQRVATCRYQHQGDLWREDIVEAYPGGEQGELLSHFRGFDGEKYYAYNADRFQGIIAPSSDALYPVTHRFTAVTDGSRFLGMREPVDLLESLSKKGISFRIVEQEQVNGEQCVKYLATNLIRNELHARTTIWISPVKGHSIIKRKEEIFGKDPQRQIWNASVTITNIFALEKTPNGSYVNKILQQDYFKTKQDGKLHWQNSYRFTLDNVQVNAEIPRAVFAVEFPPGTRIEDRILSPGRIGIVGAEPQVAANNMARGGKPKPEALDGTPASQPRPGEEFPKLSTP